MTVCEEDGLLQITGVIPETGKSCYLVASETTDTTTLASGQAFILVAQAYEASLSQEGARFDWPNGYAMSAPVVPE